jgi:hypothetical protein
MADELPLNIHPIVIDLQHWLATLDTHYEQANQATIVFGSANRHADSRAERQRPYQRHHHRREQRRGAQRAGHGKE